MDEQTRISPSPLVPAQPDVTASAETAPERPNPEQHAETLAQTPGANARVPSAGTPPAAVVPGYELISELGRGGMGVVYKAKQIKLNRIVALKMVLNAHHADPRELGRFLLEAVAVAAIRHPYVI